MKKASSSLFSFSYLPLTDAAGVAVSNSEHKLQTYKPNGKMDENKSLDPSYLNAASNTVRKGESFSIRTRLCSTTKTQNPTLHALFNWESANVANLKAQLDSYVDLGRGLLTMELAKFVKKTFDALFAILSSSKHSFCFPSVFAALLHSLALLVDKKLLKYRPLVDAYLRDFKDDQVHSLLLDLLGKSLDEGASNPGKQFMSLTKCINYVFKFVVASRKADLATGSSSISETEFKASMRSTLDKVTEIMRLQPEKKKGVYLLPSQNYTARNFPELVSDFEAVFSPSEVAEIALQMLDSMDSSEKQNVLKLNFIRSALGGVVVKEQESRVSFIPQVIQIVRKHLRLEQGLGEPYLCFSILSQLFSVMQREEKGDSGLSPAEAKAWDFQELLVPTVRAVYRIQQHLSEEIKLQQAPESVTSTCMVDLSVDPPMVLLTMLETIEEKTMTTLLSSLPRAEAFELLHELLESLKRMNGKLFDEQWTIMNLYLVLVTRNTFKKLLPFLLLSLDSVHSSSSPLPSSSPSTSSPPRSNSSATAAATLNDVQKQHESLAQLGVSLFANTFSLLETELLQLELMSEKKRQFLESRYGDLRQDLVQHLGEWWKQIPDKHKLLLVDIVPNLFEALLSRSSFQPIKTLSMNFYFDLVTLEYTQKKNFNSMEQFTVDSLNFIAQQTAGGAESDNKHAESFVKHFIQDMRARIGASDILKEPGPAFLEHVLRMYDLMFSLLKLPTTDIYEDERTTMALKILSYLESSATTRREMYLQYTQNLIDLHENLGNYIEAGLVCLRSCQLLNWTNKVLPALGKFPMEPERKRKEAMLQVALYFFNKADVWERAISCCEQLREYYAKVTFQYDEMARTLTQEAGLYKNVLDKERFYSNYFRVTYFGQFHDEIQGKEFVYKGLPLEPVMDFTNRLKKKFPKAQLSMSAKDPTPEQLSAAPNKTIISVVILTVPTLHERARLMATWEHDANSQREEWKEKAESKEVLPIDAKIAKYQNNNNIQCFSYSVADQRGGKKPENEFKDLWVNRVYLFTEDSFPTNRRRLKVVDRRRVEVTPIENAVQATQEKTEEFRNKVEQVQNAEEGKEMNLNPLIMGLNGILDAAVNGGAKKFTDAFLRPGYLKDHPDHADHQRALKSALREQLSVLQLGLSVFKDRGEASYAGLQEHLRKQLNVMKDTMKDLLQ